MPHIGRPQDYQTYAIRSPITTHFVPATCQTIDCEHYKNGWTFKESMLDAQLLHMVTHAGKRYRRMVVSADEAYLVFEPGQTCFIKHKLKLDRPEFFFVGRGDDRLFSTRRARQLNPADWTDHFTNHVDSLRTEIERG